MDLSAENKPAGLTPSSSTGSSNTGGFDSTLSEFPFFSDGQTADLSVPLNLLEYLPVPLFVKDLNGVYLACNRQFGNIFGFSVEEIVGKNISNLLGPNDIDVHLSADARLISTGEWVVYNSRIAVQHDNEIKARIIKSPLNDKSGNLKGIIGLISELYNKRASSGAPEEDPALLQKELNLLGRIEDHLRIENEMLRFENRLEIALKALNAGAWEWDPASGALLWSDKCYDIFGLEPGPVTTERWMSVIHPNDTARVREMWSRITLQAGWFDLEFRILVNEQLRWVRKSGYFVTGAEPGDGKVTGVMADISEEKDFSERLFNSQRFFKAIIEDQSELICRIRPDGSVTFVNQAFARFFEISAERFLRHFLNEVIPTYDFTRVKKLLKCIKPTKDFVNFEQRFTHENGRKSVLHWTIRAIYGKDQQIEEYQLVGRDVSEIEESREALRKSEEMFRLIAENSNDIISIHPINGLIEYVSPSVKHILGYEPESLIGTAGKRIVCEDDLAILLTINDKLRISDEPLLISLRLKHSNGALIWFESMIQPQYNSQGKATGKVIAVSRNIQSRKLVEEQQKLTELQLKEANLTKDKFFSIIAHDLRSPFTSILGFTRLLNDEYDDFTDDERKLMVKQIQNSTESTFQLLDNLLAWAKTQLGRTILSPENFSLEELITEALKQTNPQAQIKNITLTAEPFDEIVLFADKNMIRTVLRNLLSNAVKFSYPGGVVEITTRTDVDFLTISVRDEGMGIPPASLHKLFSLTEQGTTTKGTANEKGTGLGLILCREFVERNGGTIEVKSETGKGSIFSFTLPLNPSIAGSAPNE